MAGLVTLYNAGIRERVSCLFEITRVSSCNLAENLLLQRVHVTPDIKAFHKQNNTKNNFFSDV